MQNLYDYRGQILNIASDGVIVDVVSKGVDNTGLHDASAKINELIRNGGVFFFPKGTYLLDSQMVVLSNTKIIGEGSETVFKASPSMDAVYNTICNRNASNINARLCRNVSVDGHPGTAEYITEYDHDIVLMNFTVDGNWQNRDLVNWNKYYNEKETQISREPGTNLEIQSAYNVVIDHIRAINGIQHNINVRAGAYGYNMGVNYECVFPSHDIVISNCFASNERYDDCVTTHDSYNILIDNCVASVENNANGTYSKAISNGFEIDDGSRFVEVRNCKTYYAFCGFQAKGHNNTPPAHDVTFRNCQAFYTQFGFTASSGPASLYDTNKTYEGRCRNIKIIDCSIIKPYAFNNVTDWLGSLIGISILNTLNVTIRGLYVENSGAPSNVQNDYGSPLRTILLNCRELCYNTVVEGVQVAEPITNSYSSGALFILPGQTANVIIKDIVLNGFTGNPIVRANKNSADSFLIIDGIITPKLNESDKILQVASVSSDSEILLQGERKNMLFIA